jgi:hypothetical protein
METQTARPTSVKSHGQLTAEIADRLFQDLKERGYDVLYDHGDSSNENVGKIVSWYGDEEKCKRETELSQLDIAIVKQSNKVIALIEIEETNDRPKTLMGDAFCTLMGDHISFRGKPLQVDSGTTLIVMSKSSVFSPERIAFLNRKVEIMRSALDTANASIGEVVIGTFCDRSELERKLKEQIDCALQRYSDMRG